MSTASPRGEMVAHYHPSQIPGLYGVTLVDGGAPRVRVHDRHVLLALTEGEAVVWCRGETHALAPGSLLLIEPGEVHRDLRKTPYRAAMVMADAELVARLGGGHRFLGSSVVRDPALAAATVALVAGLDARAATAAQEDGLARVARLLASQWTPRPPRPDPSLVIRARRALAEAEGALVSLDELAGRLGCAPTYLCRVFSDHMGLGPHAYQLHHRLLAARRLVEAGATITEAAARTGFGDDSHLGRHFRRRFAAGPGRYRRELTRA